VWQGFAVNLQLHKVNSTPVEAIGQVQSRRDLSGGFKSVDWLEPLDLCHAFFFVVYFSAKGDLP
jgi:hypothetical protein